jgi:hypothetical protein
VESKRLANGICLLLHWLEDFRNSELRSVFDRSVWSLLITISRFEAW